MAVINCTLHYSVDACGRLPTTLLWFLSGVEGNTETVDATSSATACPRTNSRRGRLFAAHTYTMCGYHPGDSMAHVRSKGTRESGRRPRADKPSTLLGVF